MFYINTKNKLFTHDFFENSFDLFAHNKHSLDRILISDYKNYICKLDTSVVYEIIKKDYLNVSKNS